MPKILNINDKLSVKYCIDEWQKLEQIKLSTERIKARIEPSYALRNEPIAIVCYGPSLNETWEEIKNFKYVMTCSGSHKYLVERGIIPTWHCVVDPRTKQDVLMGTPCMETEYLIASACHPSLFDHLAIYNVKLWHVFDGAEEAMRMLPPGEWALTGGCNVGLRAMVIARFMGFTEQHIFGMDGSEGATGKHAAAHPIQAPDYAEVEYPEGSGQMWRTTTSFLESAKQTWHELNQMPDVKAKFYGHGLVQEMAKHYVPEPIGKGKAIIGMSRREVISAAYRGMNKELHKTNIAYGVGGGKYAKTVIELSEKFKTTSILDYGCGKGYLAKDIPFPIWEYDPAIPGKDNSPRAADICVCTDVLEHIEPEHLGGVLDDLRRCTKVVGYFVIHTGAARKTLPDGRNTHLIQKPLAWWKQVMAKHFRVCRVVEQGPILHLFVEPVTHKVAVKEMVAA